MANRCSGTKSGRPSVQPLSRSQMMARVTGKNTAPEMAVRKALWTAGVRYRIHDGRYAGRPDLFIPRLNLAVFVNGCFWHGHTCPKGALPKSNIGFWETKLRLNVLRDKSKIAELARNGIASIVLWACEPVKNAGTLQRLARRYHATSSKSRETFSRRRLRS